MIHDRQRALVTGASSGIGLALAHQFAENGFDLVVTAEDDGIEAAAARLREHGTSVDAVRLDLRTPAGVWALHEATSRSGRPLDAAALNAGVGRGGAFVETPLGALMEVVQLNVASTVHLARLLLGDMVSRGRGRVLLTSSVPSAVPGPYEAVYAASTSFVQSLAEGLQVELEGTGVTVTSLMPGPTETNFFHRAGMDETRVGRSRKDDPVRIAEQGFAALMDGERRVVAASLRTRAKEATVAVLPNRAKTRMHGRMAEPRDAARP